MTGVEVRLLLLPGGKARHIVCDSTGVKVYGEGEWKIRTDGWTKRRRWRKLHLQFDEATREIVVCGASDNSVSDDQMFVEIIQEKKEEIEPISADGAFDRR